MKIAWAVLVSCLMLTQLGDGFFVHLHRPDQTGVAIPVLRFTPKENEVENRVDTVGGSFSGTFQAEAKTLEGTWKQAAELPLELQWSRTPPKREAN